MMNILLVDDNRYVLEGIKAGIDFRKLGIENVFMITSAPDAKEIIRKVKIDIVLSDIEMPEESGLELLEWIDSYDKNIVTMFCTCYSDFNYAKKAIELKCFSYYLKPVDYMELEKLIASAIKEAESRQKLVRDQQYISYWKDNEENRKENFFMRMLNSLSDLSKEEMETEILENHLDYTESDTFLVGMLELNSDYSTLMQLNERMQLFLIRNIVTEILSDERYEIGCVYKRYYDLFVIIFKYKDCREEEIRERLTDFVEQFRMFISSGSRIFYASGITLSQIRKTVEKSISKIDESIHDDTMLYDLKKYEEHKDTYEVEKLNLNWENYMLDRDTDFLILDFKKKLEEASQNTKFRKAELKNYIIQFRAIVYAKLQKSHVEAHVLFADEGSERLYRDAARSVRRADEYAEYVLREAAEYLQSVQKTSSVLEQVKNYIDDHYNEDIGRDNIGDNVFLDANYLSVLFKQEYGVPIYQYIVNRRIAKAKELLAGSRESISAIAQKVGYPNYSYFSTLFKEKTGMSPRDYREKGRN